MGKEMSNFRKYVIANYHENNNQERNSEAGTEEESMEQNYLLICSAWIYKTLNHTSRARPSSINVELRKCP